MSSGSFNPVPPQVGGGGGAQIPIRKFYDHINDTSPITFPTIVPGTPFRAFIDFAGANVIANLPDNPDVGAECTVKNLSASASPSVTLTLNGATDTIDTQNSLVFDQQNMCYTLFYTGAEWSIMS